MNPVTPFGRALVILLFLLLHVAAGISGAQTSRISTQVSATKLCMTDTLHVEYLISGGVPVKEYKLTNASAWTRCGRPRQSQTVNTCTSAGITTKTVTLSLLFDLLPQKAGEQFVPLLEVTDSSGLTTSSEAVKMQAVTDCSQRILNSSFHTAEDESRAFMKNFDDQGTIITFSSMLLDPQMGFILSLATADRKQIRGLYQQLGGRFSGWGYKRIGYLSLEDYTELHYGLTDTTGLAARLLSLQSPATTFSYRVFSAAAWKAMRSRIEQSPEKRLTILYEGQTRALKMYDEDLGQPRNLYILFDFNSEKERAACISWAAAQGLRAPQPADLGGADKEGRYNMWISINGAVTSEPTWRKAVDVLVDVRAAFPAALFGGLILQQLKQQSQK